MKRKISIRKILQMFVTIAVTIVCISALLSASKIQDKKNLSEVVIHITNENQCKFISQEQVEDLLIKTRHENIMQTSLSELDIRHVEDVAQSNPWIADAQIYVDNNRKLQIFITQRVPAVRIFEENGTSYYLDTALKMLPLSDHYIQYSFVVTNVPELKEDSVSKDLKAQIIYIAEFIRKNQFWNAQIEQIYLNANHTFELIPTLGNHKILLGDTSHIADKFENLYAFYQKVENHIGWDKYQLLDLRYKGQVVASPTLAIKSSKTPITNMDWVKTIIDADVKDTTKVIAPPVPVKKIVPKKVDKNKNKPVKKDKNKHTTHKH